MVKIVAYAEEIYCFCKIKNSNFRRFKCEEILQKYNQKQMKFVYVGLASLVLGVACAEEAAEVVFAQAPLTTAQIPQVLSFSTPADVVVTHSSIVPISAPIAKPVLKNAEDDEENSEGNCYGLDCNDLAKASVNVVKGAYNNVKGQRNVVAGD